MMSTFELELLDTTTSRVVVALAGELDLTNARELEERLASAAPPGALLAIDVSAVVFVDSAALHVLFRLARERGPSAILIVMEPTATVSRVFEIVNMRKAVRIVESLDELDASAPA